MAPADGKSNQVGEDSHAGDWLDTWVSFISSFRDLVSFLHTWITSSISSWINKCDFEELFLFEIQSRCDDSIVKHRDHDYLRINMITWHPWSWISYCVYHPQLPPLPITPNENADWLMDLDWRNYPCLSPLSVLGVVFSSTAQGQASIFQAAVRCLRLEGLLKSNTVHYSSSLPPLDSPSLLTPHPSQLQATL